MDQLLSLSPAESEAALDQVVTAGDERFIAVFLELMRAKEIGIVISPHVAPCSPSGSRMICWHQKSASMPCALVGAPKAYPLEILEEARVVNDKVGPTPVVLVMTRGIFTVEGNSLRTGPVSYQSGGEVRAYERGQLQFSPTSDPDVILDVKGRGWQVTEEAPIGPAGEMLPRVAGHLAYWFGWFSFFPQAVMDAGR